MHIAKTDSKSITNKENNRKKCCPQLSAKADDSNGSLIQLSYRNHRGSTIVLVAAIVKRTASINTEHITGNYSTLWVLSHFVYLISFYMPQSHFSTFFITLYLSRRIICFFLKWILSGKRHVFKGFSGLVNTRIWHSFLRSIHTIFSL